MNIMGTRVNELEDEDVDNLCMESAQCEFWRLYTLAHTHNSGNNIRNNEFILISCTAIFGVCESICMDNVDGKDESRIEKYRESEKRNSERIARMLNLASVHTLAYGTIKIACDGFCIKYM